MVTAEDAYLLLHPHTKQTSVIANYCYEVFVQYVKLSEWRTLVADYRGSNLDHMHFAAVFLVLIGLLLVRCIFTLLIKCQYRNTRSSVKTMVVLGSGGHTAEMLMLVAGLDKAYYTPRVYVVAETDKMSAQRALTREQAWAEEQQAQQSTKLPGSQKTPMTSASVEVEVIPRSREVGQSYVTSVFTTLYSLLWACWMVTRQRPQLVLVNGPGTCIPVCAAAFLNRVLFWVDSRIIYVESIARVKKLSLSGAILYKTRMADAFFVQWPELQRWFPRSICAGRLY